MGEISADLSDGRVSGGQLQFEETLEPAIVASIVVVLAQFGFGVLTSLGNVAVFEALLVSFIGVISTAAFIAAIVYVVALGPTLEALQFGIPVVYGGSLLESILVGVATDAGVEMSVVVAPIDQVILFVGIALAMRWFLVDHASAT